MINEDEELERQTVKYLLHPRMTRKLRSKSRVSGDLFAEKDLALLAKIAIIYGGQDSSLLRSQIARFTKSKKILRRRFILLSLLDKEKENISFSSESFQEIIHRLVELKMLRQIEDLLVDISSDDFRKGDPQKTLEDLNKGVASIRTSYDLGEIEKKSTRELIPDYFKQDRLPGIPTGLRDLDAVVGGWKPGNLIVIASRTKGGKSIFLLNLGHNAYLQGKNVVYVTLEVTLQQWMDRYASLVSGILHDKIWKLELTDKEKRRLLTAFILDQISPPDRSKVRRELKVLRKNYPEKFTPQYLNRRYLERKKYKLRDNVFIPLEMMSHCTIDRIKQEALHISALYPIDLLLVDYPGIMEMGRKKGEGSWWELQNLFRQLKSLAGELKIPIVVAAQYWGKKGEVRYSKAILDHCDWGFAWNRTEEDELKQRIILEVIAARHTRAKKIILSEDFDRMKVQDYEEDEFVFGM